MPYYDDFFAGNGSRQPVKIPASVRERQEQHRRSLKLAMQALPSEEVLDIVSAAVVSRADYDPKDVANFSAKMSNWAWPYVVAE